MENPSRSTEPTATVSSTSRCCDHRLNPGSPPWSEWKITLATASRPPRTATAICNAAQARSTSWCSSRANPTIRREPMSRTLSRYSLPSSVGISVPSPNHIWLTRRTELSSDEVRCPPPGPAWPSGSPPPRWPGPQALLGHDRRDRVSTHRPALLNQISGDPRGAVAAAVRGEQLVDLGGQLNPSGVPG